MRFLCYDLVRILSPFNYVPLPFTGLGNNGTLKAAFSSVSSRTSHELASSIYREAVCPRYVCTHEINQDLIEFYFPIRRGFYMVCYNPSEYSTRMKISAIRIYISWDINIWLDTMTGPPWNAILYRIYENFEMQSNPSK
jgi:hypothetical protein